MLSPCHLNQNPPCPQCGLPLKSKSNQYPSYYCPNPCGWTGTRESLRMSNVKRRLRRIEENADDEWMATMAWMAWHSWDDVERMERLAERLEGLL